MTQPISELLSLTESIMSNELPWREPTPEHFELHADILDQLPKEDRVEACRQLNLYLDLIFEAAKRELEKDFPEPESIETCQVCGQLIL